eukprot:COSAG01_NODE_530_length_15875_cov_27.779982_8_plen_73_part_00
MFLSFCDPIISTRTRTHIGCLEVGQGVPVRAEAVGEGLAAEVTVAPDVARKLGGLGREDLLCVRAAATAPPV